MSLYTDYLKEIETRKEQGLHPKPIEYADLVEELIEQIKDPKNEHRKDSLHFFIYNTLPGTTSAAGAKAQFLKQIILGESIVEEITPNFEYPRALASNLFEMANTHIYFAKHLPRLTDVAVTDDDYTEVEIMLEHFAFTLLGVKETD